MEKLAYQERARNVLKVWWLPWMLSRVVSSPQGLHLFTQSKLMTTQHPANEALRRCATSTVVIHAKGWKTPHLHTSLVPPETTNEPLLSLTTRKIESWLPEARLSASLFRLLTSSQSRFWPNKKSTENLTFCLFSHSYISLIWYQWSSVCWWNQHGLSIKWNKYVWLTWTLCI